MYEVVSPLNWCSIIADIDPDIIPGLLLIWINSQRHSNTGSHYVTDYYQPPLPEPFQIVNTFGSMSIRYGPTIGSAKVISQPLFGNIQKHQVFPYHAVNALSLVAQICVMKINDDLRSIKWDTFIMFTAAITQFKPLKYVYIAQE